MENKIEAVQNESLEELHKINELSKLEEFRIKFFGKKGKITLLLKEISSLDQLQRPKFGKIINEVKKDIQQNIEKLKNKLELQKEEKILKQETVDVTMPGKRRVIGTKHPLNTVLGEVKNIFLEMNFSIEYGPDIELSKYNFDFLNAPKDHPSRDFTDTFYISESVILRTQTSPVQVRTMLNKKPPLKMISPGRVFRRDEIDKTHSPIFHQVEGLVVDKGITMANLKWTMEVFLKKLYGNKIKIRFRPHYFPFTEPSAEVDISCFKCGGVGCAFCKGEGWIEILGAGMVHPNVLKNCSIDYNVYSGFAFGMGLERITMFKFEIDDIRMFYENELSFLQQF